MVTTRELVGLVVAAVEARVANLPDNDYCTVLEEVSCDLDARVEAKREELKRLDQ